MKPTEFQVWLGDANKLTNLQREKALDALSGKNVEQVSHDLIEKRVGNERSCPRCNMIGATRHGMANGLQRYLCHHCHRTFNALTGTQMARLRKKEKWLEYAKALKESVSIIDAAARCGVNPTTAFRWRHRFLKSFVADNASKLSGIAEADETFFLESFKGQGKLPRPARKRGGKAVKRGLSSE